MARSFILIPLMLSALQAIQRSAENPWAVVLTITSPENGAVVEPGQRLTIAVDSATVRDVDVVVVGSPLGTGQVSSIPGRAFIDIPKNGKCGRFPLMAMGASRAREPIASDPIFINVERSDTPTSLVEVNGMRHMSLTDRGGTFPMLLRAIFADDSQCDPGESLHMFYSSSNPKVAVVDDHGYIAARGVGDARIRAEYRNGADRRWYDVTIEVPWLAVTLSPDTLDFGAQPVGVTSEPRTVVLKNTGQEPLRIEKVRDGGGFVISGPCIGGAALPVDGSCTLSVTFTPSTMGGRPLTLGIETDQTILPEPLHVTGMGVPR